MTGNGSGGGGESTTGMGSPGCGASAWRAEGGAAAGILRVRSSCTAFNGKVISPLAGGMTSLTR